MQILNFQDENDGSVTKAAILEDVEKVSPIRFYAQTQIETKKDLIKTIMVNSCPEFENLPDEFWYIQAAKVVESFLSDMAKTKVPENFLSLLDGNKKKKEQISLMKGQTLDPNQLFALLVNAEAKGYTFSEYHYQATPPNVDIEKLPQMIEVKEDGNVRSIGNKGLSDGQMKTVVEQTKKIVAKILDKGDEWHCFYLTFRGIAGKEQGEQGQRPHVHYISDKFGISREDLVKSIRAGNCPASSVHIGILNYPTVEKKEQ
ncbi:MAG: hypothetical protein ACLSA3_04610 [Bacteroides uniformis]|mgnify:FL=1|uniref:hypothetical protein n=1 Tax=Xylanibacter caecicola TaxID=2736294 RepID=UPI00259A1E7F|nr:hypothetical protein [Xylanibacter caecicola]